MARPPRWGSRQKEQVALYKLSAENQFKVTMLLADAANAADGKVNVLGASGP